MAENCPSSDFFDATFWPQCPSMSTYSLGTNFSVSELSEFSGFFAKESPASSLPEAYISQNSNSTVHDDDVKIIGSNNSYHESTSNSVSSSYHVDSTRAEQSHGPLYYKIYPNELIFFGDNTCKSSHNSLYCPLINISDLMPDAVHVISGVSDKQKKVMREKIAFKTKSDIEILDDGFKWRKYGKKMVKNSPNPRNYYRCAIEGCPVKKKVDRDKEDSRYVITTYEGVHNHPGHPQL